MIFTLIDLRNNFKMFKPLHLNEVLNDHFDDISMVDKSIYRLRKIRLLLISIFFLYCCHSDNLKLHFDKLQSKVSHW